MDLCVAAAHLKVSVHRMTVICAHTLFFDHDPSFFRLGNVIRWIAHG
jgi:hypothetical protein